MTKLTYKLFTLFLFLISFQVQGANPDLEWKTYETENFLIHYPEKLSSLVVKVAAYSQASHASLSEFFAWKPSDKTHVVMVDDFDQSNGYAQPMPNNTMTLFMQPPTSGELLVYDDWLKMLIHHEYTHILHLDKVLGFPKVLRKIFGRIIFSFPNALHPNWFAEGLATFHETDSEKGVGRGQSDLFEIMMRAELEDGIKPLSRINTVVAHDWPLNTAYLYGVYFFKFIHDVYGEQAIKRLINNYSNNVIPYMVGSNSTSVVGKPLDELWIDFGNYLNGYFSPQIERMKAEPESAYSVVSEEHASYGLLAAGIKGDIWFSAIDHQLGAGLYQLINDVERKVTDLNSLASIDINKQGRVLISQLEFCDQYAEYYDLFILTDDEELESITSCGRYRQAKWIDNKRILALRYEAAVPSLDVLNERGAYIRNLWKGNEKIVLSDFDVELKETGHLDVVASIKELNNPWNLYRFNQGEWNLITETQSTQTNPIVNGGEITFIQSQLGQSEAYKLDQNGSISRLTHTYTGIKQLLPIDHQSAYSLRYSSDGIQLVNVKVGEHRKLYEAIPNPSLSALTSNRHLSQKSKPIEGKPYSPLYSVLPSYWFPVYISDEDTKQVGFFTSGADALNIHQYVFQLANESITEHWLLNTNYIYDNRAFFGLEQSIDYVGESGSIGVYEKSSQWIAGYMMPQLKVSRQVYPYIAITQTEDYFYDGETNRLLTNTAHDNWLALGLIYDQFRSTRWAGDIASGFQVKASVETTEVVENSLVDSTVVNLDAKYYLPLLEDHTLAQRVFLGANLKGRSRFQLGGSKSDGYIGPGIQIKKRSYALRGYSNTSSKLSGKNILLHSVEYRLPMDWLDNSYMAPPVGFNGWSLRGFVDTGGAWDSDVSESDFRSGLGVEAILDATLGYYLGLRVRLGAAKGFGSEADDSIYLELGGSF